MSSNTLFAALAALVLSLFAVSAQTPGPTGAPAGNAMTPQERLTQLQQDRAAALTELRTAQKKALTDNAELKKQFDELTAKVKELQAQQVELLKTNSAEYKAASDKVARIGEDTKKVQAEIKAMQPKPAKPAREPKAPKAPAAK